MIKYLILSVLELALLLYLNLLLQVVSLVEVLELFGRDYATLILVYLVEECHYLVVAQRELEQSGEVNVEVSQSEVPVTIRVHFVEGQGDGHLLAQ